MSSRRVVITGIGALTPVGKSAPDFWNGLLSGKSGARSVDRFDFCEMKMIASCKAIIDGPHLAKRLSQGPIFENDYRCMGHILQEDCRWATSSKAIIAGPFF